MTEARVDRFVFLDIETTGLEEDKDYICEVGMKVTDENLNVLGEWSSLVYNATWRARMAANEYVWQMHTNSGLIKDLDLMQYNYTAYRDLSPESVSWAASKWLNDDMKLATSGIPLTGNSVQFDREFLKVHMPILHNFFTYRNIDISTLKELCYRLNPELSLKIKEKFKKDYAKHRVIPDLDGSIDELRIYIDEFLFIPGEPILAMSDDFEQIPGQQALPGMELG